MQRTLSLVVVFWILLPGAPPAVAFDTVGVNLTPWAFDQPGIVEMRWKADVLEFVNPDPETGDLKIEFNAANFSGALGNVGLGVMIQNVLHKYQEASCVVDALPGGLELYFSVIDVLEIDPQIVAGVKLHSAAEASPYFRRLYQDIDGLGIVGNNIYATTSIGDDRISDPVTVEWHLRRGNLVVDPPGNLKRNIHCEWVDLLGEFREWHIELRLNGGLLPVATYFLPEAYASHLDRFAPLVLHQEHFAACNDRLDANKTDVVYYDLAVRAEGSSHWVPLPDWQVKYSYDGECAPDPSDLRHGVGTTVRGGAKVLRSRSGHDNDFGMKRCDTAAGANILTCSEPVRLAGIDLPPGAGDATIHDLSVSTQGALHHLVWVTTPS